MADTDFIGADATILDSLIRLIHYLKEDLALLF
jgi:hypothetical protein